MTQPTPYLAAKTLTVVKSIDTSGAPRIVNLGLNESWLGPAPGAVEAMREAAGHVHRYNDPACGAMRAAIGSHFGLDPERIVCGNGSEELLDAVGRIYARAGDEILFPQYSFLQFSIVAYRTGATAVSAPLGPNFAVDVDGLLAAVSPATRVVFVATPNNPTGTRVPAADLTRLARDLPQHIVLVLDCAYAEYVEPGEAAAAFAIADRHPNVVVTRTFSKAYGLAATRAGWAYAQPPIITALNNVRGIGNVNGLAQAAATAGVRADAFIGKVREETARERRHLEAGLEALGFECAPSVANFAFARLPGSPEGWAQQTVRRLARKGFILRANEDYGMPDWLRITVAAQVDLDEFLALMAAEVRSNEEPAAEAV